MRQLEHGNSHHVEPGNEADKSLVVMGGFVDKSIEEAEALLKELLAQVDGFHDVEMTDSMPPIGLAKFDSPAKALKFIHSQKKHEGLQAAKLWASENRTRAERQRLKVVSKLKKFMIEFGFQANDVIANYKIHKLLARVTGKLVPVAVVNEELNIDWLHDTLPPEAVKDAIRDFVLCSANMPQ